MSPTGWPTTSRPAGAGGIEARPGDTAGPVAAAAASKKADPHPGYPSTPVGRGVGVGAPMLMP